MIGKRKLDECDAKIGYARIITRHISPAVKQPTSLRPLVHPTHEYAATQLSPSVNQRKSNSTATQSTYPVIRRLPYCYQNWRRSGETHIGLQAAANPFNKAGLAASAAAAIGSPGRLDHHDGNKAAGEAKEPCDCVQVTDLLEAIYTGE